MTLKSKIFYSIIFMVMLTGLFYGEIEAPEKVANAYGVEAFSKIKTLSFTFNVRKGDKSVTRKWKWQPKIHKVTFLGSGTEADKSEYSYFQNQLAKTADDKRKKIDHMFINDQYWLLFPFHLVWDKGMSVTDEGMKKCPISGEDCRCLIVTYSSEVGYTPGDIYELYLGKDFLVKEWIFRKGGSETPTLTATWEDNKRFGGILISTRHVGAEGKFKLWFTDIKIEFE